MMSRIALFAGSFSWLAATVATPMGAAAQCRLCSTPTTVAPQQDGAAAMQLEIQSNLDFGKLILLGSTSGTAVLRPDGSASVSGDLSGMSGHAMVGSASVRGEPGRAVRVDLPGTIELHSLSGSQILIEEVVTDLPKLPRLDSAGKLTFRFGGRLKIMGDADGDYRGELPITVEYL